MKLSIPFVFLVSALSGASAGVHNQHPTTRAPWGVVPRGGSDSYATQLESVKTSVLQAASESVSFFTGLHHCCCKSISFDKGD